MPDNYRQALLLNGNRAILAALVYMHYKVKLDTRGSLEGKHGRQEKSM